MPYIAIKAYPKDKAIKEKVAERISEIFVEEWGCPKEAITISVEEISPENWKEEVVDKDIAENMENMFILSGEKRF